ncbi:hypothetical protein BDE18_2470 [Paracoccus pantotrophus]|uniref:Uncharacterized protein n=1 Tax=Paracoccus pantotrophus TaxID=82367 RepID=A0AAE6TRS3_PARPN|nr:hypothetical protein [Paracoccus pantotrophus]QFG34769.1 hypothetical protein ESD82_00605 [Paracoccus pantotrophus]RKS43657.1 hypothetical protein BDE18_2470 [Paracoccus pantotrophus]
MPWYAVHDAADHAARAEWRHKARKALADIRAERAAPGFAPLERPFHLRVFGDYAAEAVWLCDDEGCLAESAAALPVAASLAARCLLWADCYETHEDAWFDHDHVADWPAPPFNHYRAINLRGFFLACALKRALPDCRIEFLDEYRNLPWRDYTPDAEGEKPPHLIEITAETMHHEAASRRRKP